MFTCELQSKDGTCAYFHFATHELAVEFGLLMANKWRVVYTVYPKELD